MKTRIDGLRDREDVARIADRITATEVIGNMRCRITLERDSHGCYREVNMTPIGPIRERGPERSAVFA